MMYMSKIKNLRTKAKVFTAGRSQAVLPPAKFGFARREVYIRREPATEVVTLSRRPADWEQVFSALGRAQIPRDFLSHPDHSLPR